MEERILNRRQQNKEDTANHKWKIIQEVKKLFNEGYSKTYIGKKLKLSRETIIKYLSLDKPPIRSDKSILDKYIPMIKELIIEGKKINEIYEAIKAKGYEGKTSLLNSRLKGFRQEIRTNTKYLKRSKIKQLLYYKLEEIKNEELRRDLEVYLKTNTELTEIIKLVRKFKESIFSKKYIN